MSLTRYARRLVTGRRWPLLDRHLTPVRDLECLKLAMGWTADPVLDEPHIDEYQYHEDANHRRRRDAEVIATACANAADGSTILEIGTSLGQTTAVMARNAPSSTIHTVNIPPEEITTGGRLTTHAPSREEIGSHYRARGMGNVRQIFANTATWKPDLPPLAVAFIDGCHDYEFVVGDTLTVLPHCRSGSVVLWHDFNPGLAYRFPWIAEVVDAIEELFSRRVLKGPVIHLQDSWVGLYRVP